MGIEVVNSAELDGYLVEVISLNDPGCSIEYRITDPAGVHSFTSRDGFGSPGYALFRGLEHAYRMTDGGGWHEG